MVQAIREAMAAQDASSVARAAHKLIGSADILAAVRVVAAARRLEGLARREQLVEAEPVFAELEQEVARLCDAIDALIASDAG